MKFSLLFILLQNKIMSWLFACALVWLSCNTKSPGITEAKESSVNAGRSVPKNDSPSIRIIHVFVALCDNKNQGIVPVPAKIGNGQDAGNNLYWGCGYGVKTYFKKQPDWTLIQTINNSKAGLLERCIFKNKLSATYLVADAYDGAKIKDCTIDFLNSCSGNFSDSFTVNQKTIFCGGSSDLIAYVGHDGLMDFSLQQHFPKQNEEKRQAIILACISKKYFSPYLKATGAEPLLWTTGLCSPEAYTLEAAIKGWLNKNNSEEIKTKAAQAYSLYQKCKLGAARNLLATGW
jgi:hypothetical protein